MTREQKAAYMRRYRAAHRKELLAYHRDWVRRNRPGSFRRCPIWWQRAVFKTLGFPPL